MFHRNQRREPRRTVWGSNLVLEFRGQSGEVYFHPVDEATQAAFFSNIKKFDEGGLKEVASQAPTESFNSGTPVAILGVEDLRKALKAGETLFTGHEPDGPARDCGICGQKFQPVRIPFIHRDSTPGVGGNFATLKAEKLQELIGKGSDLAARVKAASDSMTKGVMGNEPVPNRAKLLPVCKDCRELLGAPTFALETAREGLLNADKRIGVVSDRHEAAAILGRPQRHGAGPSDGRRSYNRRDFRGGRDRREQRPQRDWHGASLEVPTADAFDRAGLMSIQQALETLDSTPLAELEAKGLAHAGSIGPIKFALKRASEGRQVVGESRGAISARKAQFTAPGAGRPNKSSRRGKSREFTAPSTRKGGGGVGLDELREE